MNSWLEIIINMSLSVELCTHHMLVHQLQDLCPQKFTLGERVPYHQRASGGMKVLHAVYFFLDLHEMTCYDSWWTGQDGSGSECPTDARHLSPARLIWTPNRMECCRNASQTGRVTECDVLSWPLPFPVAAVGVWMLAGHSAWCQDHTSSPWQTSAHVSRPKKKTAVTQSEPVERSHSVPWRRNTLPPLAFSGGVIVGAAVGNSVVSAAMNERECIHLFSLWWGCESWNGARLPTWQLLFPREISCPVVYRIAQCHYSLAIIAIVQSTLTS